LTLPLPSSFDLSALSSEASFSFLSLPLSGLPPLLLFFFLDLALFDLLF
jgi:VIT1/CCC1 family predicted Fe2+/Mn2+ transporter